MWEFPSTDADGFTGGGGATDATPHPPRLARHAGAARRAPEGTWDERRGSQPSELDWGEDDLSEGAP